MAHAWQLQVLSNDVVQTIGNTREKLKRDYDEVRETMLTCKGRGPLTEEEAIIKTSVSLAKAVVEKDKAGQWLEEKLKVVPGFEDMSVRKKAANAVRAAVLSRLSCEHGYEIAISPGAGGSRYLGIFVLASRSMTDGTFALCLAHYEHTTRLASLFEWNQQWHQEQDAKLKNYMCYQLLTKIEEQTALQRGLGEVIGRGVVAIAELLGCSCMR